MASFDIISIADKEAIERTVEETKKEIRQREVTDKPGSEVKLDKKTWQIEISAPDKNKLKLIEKILLEKMEYMDIKPEALQVEKPFITGSGLLKKYIKIKEGIDAETGRKIKEDIQKLNLPVDTAITNDHVRVSGIETDYLQKVIGKIKDRNYDIPLRFTQIRKGR